VGPGYCHCTPSEHGGVLLEPVSRKKERKEHIAAKAPAQMGTTTPFPPMTTPMPTNMTSAPGLFLLGAGLVILQGFLTVCGTTLQRLARLDHDEATKMQNDDVAVEPVWRSRKFAAGLALYILAQPLSILSLSLLPVSVHGPLLCAAIIVASGIVSRAIGERARWQDYVGLGLGVLGACGLLLFGPTHSDPKENIALGLNILTFWLHPGINWFIPTIIATLIAGLPLALLRTRLAPISHPLCCALLGGTGDCMMKVITMFAVQTAEFSAAHIVEYAIIIVTYGILAVSNVLMVSLGAQRFDSRYFMPGVMVLFTLQMQLFGLIAYRELDSLGEEKRWLFALFSLCCVASVWIASRNPGERRSSKRAGGARVCDGSTVDNTSAEDSAASAPLRAPGSRDEQGEYQHQVAAGNGVGDGGGVRRLGSTNLESMPSEEVVSLCAHEHAAGGNTSITSGTSVAPFKLVNLSEGHSGNDYRGAFAPEEKLSGNQVRECVISTCAGNESRECVIAPLVYTHSAPAPAGTRPRVIENPRLPRRLVPLPQAALLALPSPLSVPAVPGVLQTP